jgi:neutral ceramidase
MTFTAGAAQIDITPREPVFLFGYPHVPRISTGVHDPLYAAALYLHDGEQSVLLVAVDVLMLAPEVVSRCRDAITAATGIPAENILVSTTHTHSAPVTCDVLAFREDPVVPPADPGYLDRVCEGIVGAARRAQRDARPARLAVTRGIAQGVGSNRHDPAGPCDPEVGILAVRDAATDELLALDLVYSMHPTVLHEDSTLISADFPGFTRAYLAARFPGVIVVYHTGPSGNQSPRYTVTGQTFAEARRLGESLGETVAGAVGTLVHEDYAKDVTVAAASTRVTLPARTFPTPEEAEAELAEARATHARLVREGAPHGPRRTAEVAVFGAEERVTLARAQARGDIAELLARYAEAEVQVLRAGSAALVGLPGELFVEFGLAIKTAGSAMMASQTAAFATEIPLHIFVISLANGELQGYITTPGATGYEAGISLFLPEGGVMMVKAALDLLSFAREGK